MNRYHCTLLSSALFALNLSASPVTLVEYNFDDWDDTTDLHEKSVTPAGGAYQPFVDAGGGSAWVANTRWNADSSYSTSSVAQFSGYIGVGTYINDSKGTENGLFEYTATFARSVTSSIAFSTSATPSLTAKSTDTGSAAYGSFTVGGDGSVVSRLSLASDPVTHSDEFPTDPAFPVTLTIGLDFRPSSGYNGTDNFGTISFASTDGVLRTHTMTTNVNFNSIFIGSQISTIQSSTVPVYSGSYTLTQTLSESDPFTTWATSGTLPGTVTFDGDLNGDGVQDGIAFLLGVANPDDDATGALPTVSEDGSGNLVLTFDCLALADRGGAQLKVAHSNSLAGWTATTGVVPDADGTDAGGVVSYVVDTVSADPLHRVTATIDSSAASAGRLFGRLEGAE